jgi:hypothetical protein
MNGLELVYIKKNSTHYVKTWILRLHITNHMCQMWLYDYVVQTSPTMVPAIALLLSMECYPNIHIINIMNHIHAITCKCYYEY